MAIIAHVDMDCFYASVEMAKQPQLRAIPMYVGGGNRGVVLSANYPARTWGIRSGMSHRRAAQLCPQVVVIPADMDSYQCVSDNVFDIFNSITDKVERVSIDEGFLDISGSQIRLGTPLEIGEKIRRAIAEKEGISCTVGIGPNKLVAKMATNHAKPDGLIQIRGSQVRDFLAPQKVENLWLVGESTVEKLNRLGLYTVAAVVRVPKSTLVAALGARRGDAVYRTARGEGDAQIVANRERRSISSVHTFKYDVVDDFVIKAELLRLSMKIAANLRQYRLLGKTITVTVRFADFTTVSRSVTIANPTDVTDEIYAHAVDIYDRWRFQRARIRLVGIQVSSLFEAGTVYIQPCLDAPEKGMREVERALDQVRHRFGQHVVTRGTLARCGGGMSP